MIQLKTILVPTDFSVPSTNALKYARAFSDTFGAVLHVMHVLDDALFFGWEAPPVAFEEIEQGAKRQLEQVLTEAEQKQYRAAFALRRGRPFLEIVRYAKEQSIDLIVMGTHGRGAIAHMLMGSVAEKVVRKAPCPVLTVRHPEHEFVMP